MFYFLALFALINIQFIRCEDSTRTVFAFSRKIQTCDEQDREIEEGGATKVIWSYADTDPVDDNIPIHTHRGSKTVHFTNQQPNAQFPPDTKYFYVGHHNHRPPFDSDPRTRYSCSLHKVDMPSDRPLQIVRAEPVVDPRNEGMVHHMIIYVCYGKDPSDELFNYIGDCLKEGETPNCAHSEMVMEWAVGGTAFDWPPHVGYRLDKGHKYYMMEIHYDNPTHREVEDSSGMNFYYTEKYFRKYDGGITSIGWNSADSRITIPPGRSRYELEGWCYSDCTSKWPEPGMYVIGAKLHTHLRGRSGKMRVFRDGVEQPPMYDDPYYDFDFQDFAILPEEYHVLPGDVIKQECYYDTTGLKEPIHFGVATTNEMCHSWIMYYPKLPHQVGHCRYLDFNLLPGEEFKGHANFCGAYELFNIQVPNTSQFVEYVPPACEHHTPPDNITQPTYKSVPLSAYQQKVQLDPEHKYQLYWTYDPNHRVVHMAVDVQTPGWVGLGFGPSGMTGADIAMGWVKDQDVQLTDRFSKTEGLPDVDTLQDYFYISAEEIASGASFLETEALHGTKASMANRIQRVNSTIPTQLLPEKNQFPEDGGHLLFNQVGMKKKSHRDVFSSVCP
jgi:hypothetical protein